MRRIGWHLDDVPQPFLTVRRVAFAILILMGAAAIVDGLLIGYEGTHHRSLGAPLVLLIVNFVVGGLAGGLFGWTNKKSPRWREWRKTMPTMTPGWPPSGSRT